jgi:hypothetical protein
MTYATYKLTAIQAAEQISRYVEGKLIRRLPLVARQEAIKAVRLGACPRGVAECIREAAR